MIGSSNEWLHERDAVRSDVPLRTGAIERLTTTHQLDDGQGE
jgi:hypothetical protein